MNLLVFSLLWLSGAAVAQLTQDGSGLLALTSYEYLLPSTEVLAPLPTPTPSPPTPTPDDKFDITALTSQPVLLLPSSIAASLPSSNLLTLDPLLPTNIPSFSPSPTPTVSEFVMTSQVFLPEDSLSSTGPVALTSSEAMFIFPLLSSTMDDLDVLATTTNVLMPDALTITLTSSHLLPSSEVPPSSQATFTRTAPALQSSQPSPTALDPLPTSTREPSTSEAVLIFPDLTPTPTRLFLMTEELTSSINLTPSTTQELMIMVPELTPFPSDEVSLSTIQPSSTMQSSTATRRTSSSVESDVSRSTAIDFFFFASTTQTLSALSPSPSFSAEPSPPPTSVEMILFPMESSEVAALPASSFLLSSPQPSLPPSLSPSLQPSPQPSLPPSLSAGTDSTVQSSTMSSDVIDFIAVTSTEVLTFSTFDDTSSLTLQTRLLSPSPLPPTSLVSPLPPTSLFSPLPPSSLFSPSPSPTVQASTQVTISTNPTTTTSSMPPFFFPLSSSISSDFRQQLVSTPLFETPSSTVGSLRGESSTVQTLVPSTLVDSLLPTPSLFPSITQPIVLVSLFPSLTESSFPSTVSRAQTSAISAVTSFPSLLQPDGTSSLVLVIETSNPIESTIDLPLTTTEAFSSSISVTQLPLPSSPSPTSTSSSLPASPPLSSDIALAPSSPSPSADTVALSPLSTQSQSLSTIADASTAMPVVSTSASQTTMVASQTTIVASQTTMVASQTTMVARQSTMVGITTTHALSDVVMATSQLVDSSLSSDTVTMTTEGVSPLSSVSAQVLSTTIPPSSSSLLQTQAPVSTSSLVSSVSLSPTAATSTPSLLPSLSQPSSPSSSSSLTVTSRLSSSLGGVASSFTETLPMTTPTFTPLQSIVSSTQSSLSSTRASLSSAQASLSSTQAPLSSITSDSTIPTPQPPTPPSSLPPSSTPITSPPPRPLTCPTLLVPGEAIPSTSLVRLRLALTVTKHNLISQDNSLERCELEEGLAVAIFGSDSKGLVVRRQASGSGYNADITNVGALAAGTSVVTFYIINATDQEAPPTFVPSATVLAAIEARNITQVLTYPIIGIDAPPTNPASLTVPLAAGLGVALFLLVVLALSLVVCVSVIIYNGHRQIKVETIRGAEAGSTFARTNDFEFSEDPSTPATPTKKTKSSVSLGQLANGWMDGGEATPIIDRDTPSSRHEPIPAGLFERVAHYESATPPQPSPSTRALKLKFRNSVAPSPSISNKSHSSEAEPHPLRGTPSALRPRHKSAVVRETIQSKEESLRLQERHEEDELKARRKATLERLMLQSRQRDSEIRSRIGSRRKKRRGSIAPDNRVRPSTYGGAMTSSVWETREPELDAAMGDVDSSSPFATPHPGDAMATTPRPSTRPSTKRRAARRRGNKVAPVPTTDDYDSTDHAPHPYHMMVDPRGERRFVGSRTGSRQKHGRSQRGRPFSREQSQLATSGRRSRAVGRDVQRELAWMETPGGVQLMRIQPIMPAAAVAPPTYSLPPPHPTIASGGIITVQPRPHPKAMAPPPPRHSTLENLPALAPPTSQNFTHKQLETLWREIEKFQLDQTMRRDSTTVRATPSKKATPPEQAEEEQPNTKPLKTEKSGDGSEPGEPAVAGEGGEAAVAGVGGVGGGSEDEVVKSKEQADLAQASQDNESHEHPPATPLGSAPPILPDVDSSYSSAVIQELLQQAFSASQSQGAGQTWSRSANSTYQESMDSGGHVLSQGPHPPTQGGGGHGPPTTGSWHSQPQAMAPPTQMYATPPTHYSGLPGQLVWAPPDPHTYTPLHTQVISPAHLSHLRQSQSYGHHDYDQSNLINYGDPFQPSSQPPTLRPQYPFSPYSRYQQRRHDPFS